VEKPVVLLVDDNEAICTLITAVLQPEFSVEVVSDGAVAIDRVKSRQYAAILLDLLMPMTDGFAVLDVLAERPDLLRRTIVVTAALSPRELTRVRAYEICCIVGKPFDVETLRSAVKQCIGGFPFKPGTLLAPGMLLLLADLLRPM